MRLPSIEDNRFIERTLVETGATPKSRGKLTLQESCACTAKSLETVTVMTEIVRFLSRLASPGCDYIVNFFLASASLSAA